MNTFLIYGGKKLFGEINIDACKNAILPIMAASILVNGETRLTNCTMYSDVQKMCEILKKLGSKIKYKNKTLFIDNRNLKFEYISNDLTKDIRASIFTLGPMLARFGKAKIAYPGGCAIGQRSISIHLSALKQMGAVITEKHGYIYAKCENTKSEEIYFDFPSVGATENVMMFACLSNGKFKIHNVAKEPEIVDLANFLNKMGAKIVGAGTDCIEIEGVKNLNTISYRPIADRITTGTFLIACAMTGGEIKLKKCCPKHNEKLIDILRKMGCDIITTKSSIKIVSNKKLKFNEKIETSPYPGFPTDLQSQLTALFTVSSGVSFVKENIFECRFRYVPELIKMGAKIEVNNNTATIEGKKSLFGADVYSTDLRGGVALVLAGLVAKGYTTVHNVEYIDRGYFELEKQLSSLGAQVQRL